MKEIFFKLLDLSVNHGAPGVIISIMVIAFMSMLVMTPLRYVYLLIISTQRHNTIRKMGYPPSHCDSDGQLKEEYETDSK